MRQRQTRLQTNCQAMLHLADKTLFKMLGILMGLLPHVESVTIKYAKRLTIKYAKRLIIKHIKYLTIQIVLVKIATVFLFQQLFHEPVGL